MPSKGGKDLVCLADQDVSEIGVEALPPTQYLPPIMIGILYVIEGNAIEVRGLGHELLVLGTCRHDGQNIGMHCRDRRETA